MHRRPAYRISQSFTAAQLRAALPWHDKLKNPNALKLLSRAMKERHHNGAMESANLLLEGFGIEAIESKDAGGEEGESFTDEGVRFCPRFSYVNVGYTYATTLVRDHKRQGYILASWGDLVERFGDQ